MELVFGLVENIEYAPLRIQAILPDKDDMLSPFALVITPRSQSAKHFDPPVKGEQVAILLTDDGETAICLGSVFSDVDNAPANRHQFAKVFDDGTELIYDNDSHTLTVNATGTINIICQNANIRADKTVIDGAVEINGDTAINGTATISKDAVIGGRSFKTHTHGGVRGGNGSTTPPI
ncbi:MAG: phage baseplate assembly protein V [Moraxella sp.]|nr:phage baseplate assembly protein V [Moraxella sp.]